MPTAGKDPSQLKRCNGYNQSRLTIQIFEYNKENLKINNKNVFDKY